MPDEDFKRDIGSIRKEAEKALFGALVKFHRRSIERLTNKFKKLMQTNPRKSNSVNKQQSSNRKQPPTAGEKIVKKREYKRSSHSHFSQDRRHIAGKTQVKIKI